MSTAFKVNRMFYVKISEVTMKLKIPVLFYLSFEEEYIRKFLLQSNLNDFIAKGDVFQLYKKISKYIKGSLKN